MNKNPNNAAESQIQNKCFDFTWNPSEIEINKNGFTAQTDHSPDKSNARKEHCDLRIAVQLLIVVLRNKTDEETDDNEKQHPKAPDMSKNCAQTWNHIR